MDTDLSPPSGVGGSRFGRYEFLGTLARGGMATVYLARHTGEGGFARLYALKVMHEHLADEGEFVAMLLDEARLAARLHHINAVPIVDLGVQDGRYYLVMEYVEGCSLAALLAANPNTRPPELVIEIVLDMLAGLHAAHTLTDDDGHPLNIVHRDVSPHNVIVGVDGTARITDFGIAKARSTIHSTRPGELRGKLGYMSPEQIQNASRVDARSDVFAAGIVLWTALTGEKLFSAGEEAEAMYSVLNKDVPPPSTVGLKPPAALDPIVLRALERDPSRRYQSAADLEEELRMVAAANGLLGHKREVGAWVTSSVGHDLATRRASLRPGATDPSSGLFIKGPSEPPRARLSSGFEHLPPGRARLPSGPDRTPSRSRPPGPNSFTPTGAGNAGMDASAPMPSRDWRDVALVMVGVIGVTSLVAAAWLVYQASPFPSATASVSTPSASPSVPSSSSDEPVTPSAQVAIEAGASPGPSPPSPSAPSAMSSAAPAKWSKPAGSATRR